MICVRCACGNCNRYERSSSSAAAASLTDIYLHNSLCTHTKMKRKKEKIAYLILDPLLPFRHFATDDKTKPQRERKRKASILFSFFFSFTNVFFSVTEIFSLSSLLPLLCVCLVGGQPCYWSAFFSLSSFSAPSISHCHTKLLAFLSLSLFFSGSLWPRFRSKGRKKIRLVR